MRPRSTIENCSDNPANLKDPTGLFSQVFGELAHDVIASRYWAEHPGTIINPTTGILGALKPDIFNGPGMSYAEIKPLSFPGIGQGIVQMPLYDAAYGVGGKLGLNFHRETAWPRGFGEAYIAANWIVYFNVDGLIFYTDAHDAIEDLKKIKKPQDAYRVLRGLVNKSFNAAKDVIKSITRGVATAEEAEMNDEVGIATIDSAMGAP